MLRDADLARQADHRDTHPKGITRGRHAVVRKRVQADVHSMIELEIVEPGRRRTGDEQALGGYAVTGEDVADPFFSFTTHHCAEQEPGAGNGCKHPRPDGQHVG